MKWLQCGSLLLLAGLSACSNMNNATTGVLTGGVIGGTLGAAVGSATCSSSTCREVMVLGGAAVGALLGYKIGYEKDLALARSLEEELRKHGYQPVLKTGEVEVEVPIDKRSGQEVNDIQLVQVPEVHRGTKKKKILRLQSLSVTMKKPGDAAEAVALSQSFVESLRKGSERPKRLSMPVISNEQLAMAKRYNVNLKRNAKSNSTVVLSYGS
ncbi:glycine zipper 2TM domain-containing protein [Vogesella indigofera]|uniref:glycine zipper 2TM domain-containing protein n=1 Tax=Vogesella indigofera TaxID=45465 RepID=UPI00234F4AC0|nr:glycine zipper 2TM domain-containing protein [Vogesella indigofera]MDC7712158.1 glycine zipper 2TM domain-containing protein [Vogesella indigofera]